LRFLARLVAIRVPKEGLLSSVKTVAAAFGVDPRNPKWTSYGALELDVFSPSATDFELFLAGVRPFAEPEFTKNLSEPPPYRTEDELFSESRALFNAERYWECHEVLEGVWRWKKGDEKRLLQGIILVCAAFVHHQKGEEQVAMGVLKRAVKQLEYSRPGYGGYDIPRLRREVEAVLRDGKFMDFGV
jgi:uncharacterized protein